MPPPHSMRARAPRPPARRRLPLLKRRPRPRALLAAAAVAAVAAAAVAALLLLPPTAALLHHSAPAHAPAHAPAPAAHPPVERVPAPYHPPPADRLSPPPPDPRLPPLVHPIDPAQPLLTDDAVDHLRVVPVDAPPAPDRPNLPPISALVLFHNEYRTLNHTLHTWIKNDLISHLAELLFFLNGVSDPRLFYHNLPVLQHAPWAPVTRVHHSPDNLNLGLAIRKMVQLASHPYVLLLEKDWALIEPPHVVAAQLALGASLLNASTAHVVRYRHRRFPGAPLHARIMHQNREPQMLAQQSNLYCYIHHWVQNPLANYSNYFSTCNATLPEQQVWCAPARFCQWTNNPALFKRHWFLTELADRFQSDYKITSQLHPDSHMLDFEFYTNWNSTVWNDRPFVVALPNGLFEHHEIGEQNLMNTVWYAWNRLSTDVQEKRQHLLRTHRQLCNLTTTNNSNTMSTNRFDSGPTFEQRFPIHFVRLYHYNQSMTRTTADALQLLSAESHRVQARLEQGHGTWRHAVTDLTNLWYTAALYTYPTEPQHMNIAFVTALFPAHPNSEHSAARTLAHNIHRLAHHYPVIVYCSNHTRAAVSDALANRFHWQPSRIRRLVLFHVSHRHDLLLRLLGAQNMQRVSRLYHNRTWHALSSLRSQRFVPSEHAVALSLAKPYVLDDAVQLSERRRVADPDDAFGALSHFVWMDASSKCVRRARARRRRRYFDHVLRAHMMLNAVATGVRASSLDELETALYGSGFRADRLLHEMQLSVSDGVRVVDMKSVGGSKIAIRLLSAYYDAVLRDLLRNGQLGVGREALSIALHNVQYNFNFVNGLCACAAHEEQRDGCCGEVELPATYMAEDSEYGCALFARMGECGGGDDDDDGDEEDEEDG